MDDDGYSWEEAIDRLRVGVLRLTLILDRGELAGLEMGSTTISMSFFLRRRGRRPANRPRHRRRVGAVDNEVVECEGSSWELGSSFSYMEVGLRRF